VDPLVVAVEVVAVVLAVPVVAVPTDALAALPVGTVNGGDPAVLAAVLPPLPHPASATAVTAHAPSDISR
jgi:hypothetical protein